MSRTEFYLITIARGAHQLTRSGTIEARTETRSEFLQRNIEEMSALLPGAETAGGAVLAYILVPED